MIPEVRSVGQDQRRYFAASAFLLTAAGLWGARHIAMTAPLLHGRPIRHFELLFFTAFLFLAWNIVTAHIGMRAFRCTNRQRQQLDQLVVVANVPTYNEDPTALKAALSSIFAQTRLPQVVSVVDDGSDAADYSDIKHWAMDVAAQLDVELHWVRQENAGKRHAQARTFRAYPDADIYLTLDSDTMLDSRAIEEGLKPFKSERVASVAGFLMTANVNKSIVTRGMDLILVMWQSLGRASSSVFGAVLVNSGPIAFYRGKVIADKIDVYVGETFMGHKVKFSDDAMLTTFALTHGRAVQQPSSFALSLMPENFSHHLRQYTRWMRGSTIRAFWRLRYLPMNTYAWWLHAMSWVQLGIGLVIFVNIFGYEIFVEHQMIPYYLAVPALLGYAQGLRYLTFARSDVTFRSQLLTFALSPLVCIYCFFVLRAIRWYGVITCTRTEIWGTRQEIEVRLDEGSSASSAASMATLVDGLEPVVARA